METLVPQLWAPLAVAGLAAACGGSPAPGPASSAHRAAWTYADPARWGDLDASYAARSHGTKQSPIDLPRLWSQVRS